METIGDDRQIRSDGAIAWARGRIQMRRFAFAIGAGRWAAMGRTGRRTAKIWSIRRAIARRCEEGRFGAIARRLAYRASRDI